MSIKLTELGNLLNENESLRYQVSYAYSKGIINGEPNIEVIANNLFELSKTVNSELEFTHEEILSYLSRNKSKPEIIPELVSSTDDNQQDEFRSRYGFVALYNSGAFVCDKRLYTENVLQSLFHHGNNICVGQSDRTHLVWFEGMGRLRNGAQFQMMPHVYLALEGAPISPQMIYDRDSRKCANFEIAGTTCKITFRYLGDTYV